MVIPSLGLLYEVLTFLCEFPPRSMKQHLTENGWMHAIYYRHYIISMSDISSLDLKIIKTLTYCFFPLMFSDLSNNRIGCLTVDVFQGLTYLTKL